MTLDLVILAVMFASGAAAGYGVRWWRNRVQQDRARREEEAHRQQQQQEAEAILRETRLTANEEALKLREQTERMISLRRRELNEWEQRLNDRENLINSQLEGVVQQEKGLRQQRELLQRKIEAGERERQKLEHLREIRNEQLQKTAQLSSQEARHLLLKEVEEDSLKDSVKLARHIIGAAKERAEAEARRILSIAIQRYAGSHTSELTTTTVALQGDDIKGRIIGREGRNIRAFEAATGVTVLIDDTPNAVVLSGFDPVRREVAREAMQRLIADGRIHPTRIEEVVAKVSEETDETIRRAGEEAVYRSGVPPLHAEIVKVLGRLRFRRSFSQNILEHSIEVADLMGLIATELRMDPSPAKRAGLLHDIGKAMNHEVEGSHALIGADFLRRYGEPEEVVQGVASHHHETEETSLLGTLVSAADAISASRPGARSESMTTYLKRLEHLERIAQTIPGIEKCFAIQAGRELRIFVNPQEVNDEQAYVLARKVARKIEDELQYPGQIRVTVIREIRCIEVAK